MNVHIKKLHLIWLSHTTAPILLVFIAGYILMTLNACKKENLMNTTQAESASTDGTTMIPSCSDPLSAFTVLDLIRTPDEPVNDRINMILYHYAQALRVLTQSPTHRCYLESAMMADTGGVGISLYSIAQENSSFAQALNMALRQSMATYEIYPRGVEEGIESSISDPNWDANTFLRSKMIYPPYKYEPVAYYVKRPTECEPTRQLTIVIAQDVNDCDDVAGWRGANEVLVSENEANSSSDPIIFVGPGLGVYQSTSFTGGVNEVVLTEDGIDKSSSSAVKDRSDLIDLYQIKAGYRYESSKKSEIDGWVIRFTPSTSFGSDLRPWASNTIKIHKDDINASRVFTNTLPAFALAATDYSSGRSVFFGTWECDWWASKKVVVNPCSVWIPHSVSIRMKYSHEWYFFTCGVASTFWPSTGSVWEIDNEKCRFRLRRTL